MNISDELKNRLNLVSRMSNADLIEFNLIVANELLFRQFQGTREEFSKRFNKLMQEDKNKGEIKP